MTPIGKVTEREADAFRQNKADGAKLIDRNMAGAIVGVGESRPGPEQNQLEKINDFNGRIGPVAP